MRCYACKFACKYCASTRQPKRAKRRASTVHMHTRVSMVQVHVMRECRITRETAKFVSENWKSHTRTQMF